MDRRQRVGEGCEEKGGKRKRKESRKLQEWGERFGWRVSRGFLELERKEKLRRLL